MKDIDKNIACIDFTKFETFDDYQEWMIKKENGVYINFQYVNLNIDEEKDTYLSIPKIFSKTAKIWIIGKYVVATQYRGSDGVIMNPDLSRFIVEDSYDAVTDPKKVVKIDDEETNSIKEDMTIDSILDKISEVGIENLTKSERKFLDNVNK